MDASICLLPGSIGVEYASPLAANTGEKGEGETVFSVILIGVGLNIIRKLAEMVFAF